MKAALIGQGISGSLTPDMHMAEARAQGFDYDYLRIDTETAPYTGQSLRALLDRAADQGLAGVNVTHPYKSQAAEVMDDMSDTARLLGAVNTVLFQDGRRIGHNTDYVGYRSALRRGLPHAQITRCLLIGAGGAGSAVALALIDQGTEVLFILEQDRPKAEELKGRLNVARPRVIVNVVDVFAAVQSERLDGIVNATPMGMAAHPGMALDPTGLQPGSWVSDIVYFPRRTALLARAEELRLRTMDGSGMAIFQAAAAFHLLTGRTASPNRMCEHFEKVAPKSKEVLA
ncbi:shikimate dehydrogenase [Aliiroseovarius crassostreae]|uniref:shikimate dehydrogenase n=1 Tax=Aliiroseovarius crassostreae TaxID=154981 RepID=UPI00220EF830|nr:shikimate dehydrogenase [Aliiroseovarius crassostreae]UWQ04923.1 shikimate dehydrogenase [Aliiroseovarius crassostreae]